MNIELRMERGASSEDSPIVFGVTKPSIFTADGFGTCFQTEVWCTDADVTSNACKLRAFFEKARNGGIQEHVSIVFGVAEKDMSAKVHPGKCVIRLFAQTSGRLIASVSLTSGQPGMETSDLLDTCAIYYETEESRVADFISKLEQLSNFPSQASLRGFELGTL